MHDGVEYPSGKTFSIDNGCNTCECDEATIKCTENVCSMYRTLSMFLYFNTTFQNLLFELIEN